jgi:hypothetical protein
MRIILIDFFNLIFDCRVGGHITKMIENSPYSFENKLLRLITETKSTNETTRKNALNSLLDERFMNDNTWFNTVEDNQKNYTNELAVNMTKFVTSKFDDMNVVLQTQFRKIILNLFAGTTNAEHKENMITIILDNAKNSDKYVILVRSKKSSANHFYLTEG